MGNIRPTAGAVHFPHWRATTALPATWWSLPLTMPTTTKSREPMTVVSGLMSASNYSNGGVNNLPLPSEGRRLFR